MPRIHRTGAQVIAQRLQVVTVFESQISYAPGTALHGFSILRAIDSPNNAISCAQYLVVVGYGAQLYRCCGTKSFFMPKRLGTFSMTAYLCDVGPKSN